MTGPMVAFVHAMEDESSKNEEAVSMLRDVAKLHVKNSKDSMVGKGIDRCVPCCAVLATSNDAN